jgi:hypothetical protein
MRVEDKLSGDLQDALRKGLLKRIPLTFLPFVNQQLNQWETLFPNERQSVERLLLYVASMNPQQSADLFRNVVEIEEKMGVRHWQFSTNEQTIQNSSQLAASPYFQDWRRAVQAVFDAANQYALKANGYQHKTQNRLVLLHIPPSLSVDSASVWRRWQGAGRTMKLDLSQSTPSQIAFELLVSGELNGSGRRAGGLIDAARSRPNATTADTWVVDAGMGLVESALATEPAPGSSAGTIVLGYARLNRYRESFSHEMNTMRKDLADADAVFDRLRKVDVKPWCPAEIEASLATREFVRSLYLSGNGAVIFGNSFVEWAASEALRRARPSFLAAQFGVRTKPKPFTGVAVFDNPDQVNPLPAADDLPGSARDAQMLALYVWLAANRYEEYQHSTVCVCVAESLAQAYVVAPSEFPQWRETETVTLGWLKNALSTWMA